MQLRALFRFIALLVLLFPAAVSGEETGRDDPQAAFEAFWSLFDENYALFGPKHVDWDAVYGVYRPRVTAQTSREELFAIFTEATNLLNDVHVTVEDARAGRRSRSGGRSLGTGPFDTGVFSLDLIASAYAPEGLQARAGNIIHFGWLKGGVGYAHLSAFKYPTSSEQAIDEIVGTFEGARAIIIDVRQNGGGSDKVGQLVANRFAAETRLYMTVARRVSETDRYAFGEAVEWRVSPGGPDQFTGPVIILANSRTISAAENFIMAMRENPRAVVIGETTAGVMADAYTMRIANDWSFGVPINLFRDSRGVCWEGIGLAPDLWITNDPADIEARRDRVLETALAFAAKDMRPRERMRVKP